MLAVKVVAIVEPSKSCSMVLSSIVFLAGSWIGTRIAASLLMAISLLSGLFRLAYY